MKKSIYDVYVTVTSQEQADRLKAICKPYQQAKDRVLFEGFEIIKPSEKCYILLCSKNTDCQFLLEKDFSFNIERYMDITIEDLVKYDLTLTASAIKQFNETFTQK